MSAELTALARDSWAVSPLATLVRFFGPGISAPEHLRYVSNCIVDMWNGTSKTNALASSWAPRHGKSWLCTLATPLWALSQNCAANIGIACYSDDLAQSFSKRFREVIVHNADVLGFTVSPDSRSVERFTVTPGGGTVLARGILSSWTGHGLDLLCADDLIRSQIEASSPTYLEQLFATWQSTIRTRMQPNSKIILANCRWAAEDPIGKLQKSPDAAHWEFVSLPALAGEGDALGREPGTALWPSQFDEASLEDIKSAVGESAFQTLYCCSPEARGVGSRVFYSFNSREHVGPVADDPSADL
jgi:hypothetical protein